MTEIETNIGEDSGAAPAERRQPEPTATPTLADWQAAAVKEVKGKDLTWPTPEGIAVKPLYTAADIGPRTERPPRPGHQHRPRAAERIERRRQLLEHRGRRGVEPIRPIERQDEHVATTLGQDVVFGHAWSPPSRVLRTRRMRMSSSASS